MLEKTLLNALAAYRRGIRIEGGLHAEEEICHIIEHIDACVEYLNPGNRVNGTWMGNNYLVLSRAVKRAHDIVHSDCEMETDNDELNEEHRDLNRCMTFYRDFYEQNEIDLAYMSM